MRIVCQQTILMKNHALFVFFLKSSKILNCRLLQNVGCALRVNCNKPEIRFHKHTKGSGTAEKGDNVT